MTSSSGDRSEAAATPPRAPWLTAARIVGSAVDTEVSQRRSPPVVPTSPAPSDDLLDADSSTDSDVASADSDADSSADSDEEELLRVYQRTLKSAPRTSLKWGPQDTHKFHCDILTCGMSFTRRDHLTRHHARFHEAKSDREFTCEVCELRFATRHEKELHDREVTHQFPCKVPGCAKSYSKREHLTRHSLSIHKSDEQEKPFRCELCQIGFAYSHGLARHMKRSHLNENKPYTCGQCLLAFKKKSELQAHSFVHTGVLPFECSECGARFAKRFKLGQHERQHAANKEADTRVLFCEEAGCGQVLFSAEEKATHEAEVHSKPATRASPERPAQQEAAAAIPKKRKRGAAAGGAIAKTDGGLEATRRQLLKCEVCGLMLQRKQNLRAHLRTHFEAADERKMHACPVAGCANAYTRKSNLMAHYNAVHDAVRSQRFVCLHDGCAGRFGYKKVLLTHLESVHASATPPSKRAKPQGKVARPAKARVLGIRIEERDIAAVAAATTE
ncbi:hypothetical protein PybrP1_002848 [[Pythium] brassicae (nom. inval.)]|nr:hypothetical protein PybrP1_002848 [[Pythium] brassicae (nom. inval.)]